MTLGDSNFFSADLERVYAIRSDMYNYGISLGLPGHYPEVSIPHCSHCVSLNVWTGWQFRCVACVMTMRFMTSTFALCCGRSGYVRRGEPIPFLHNSSLISSRCLVRDSRRWLTDADEIEQREVVCWELVCMEVWQVAL